MRIENKKKILIGVMLVFLLGLFFFLPSVQAADNLNLTKLQSNSGLSGAKVEDILTKLLTWLLGIVGVIALIGFVISGIQYIVAAGNDKIVESAKKNMTYSMIGIVVVLASFVIIQALDSIMKAGGNY